MRVLSKELFIRHQGNRPVFPGFVSYASTEEPLLIHRFGWVDYSDGYDDFADSFSEDGGLTWSEPVMRQQSRVTPEGRVRYAENAAMLDPDTGKLLTFTSRALYPSDHLDVDGNSEAVLDVFDPAERAWAGERRIPVDPPGGLQISFCFPIKTIRGEILVPAMTKMLDDAGRPIHYQGCWAPAEEPFVLIGKYRADGTLSWEKGHSPRVDIEQNSRGLSESTIARICDGRIAMIARGDNSMFPERPGHKWLCFTEDEGRTWSDPEPLPCTGGDPIESGSNGSALFRSIKTGSLYWMGNLAMDGRRANGNWPRSPLVIAEVQEEPFALIRESITVIDQQAPGESDEVQMSNFRFYQDRDTGDVSVFLSRFGEHSAKEWYLADYYRYRLEVP